jgi:hypothetical protein
LAGCSEWIGRPAREIHLTRTAGLPCEGLIHVGVIAGGAGTAAQGSLFLWATYMYGMAVLRAYTSRVRQRGVVMTNNHQGELQASTPALDFPTLEALSSTPASRGLRPHLLNPALPVCALTSFHDLGDPAIALLHSDRLPSALLLPLPPACLFHSVGDPRAGSPSNAAHDKAKRAPPDIQPHAAFVEPTWTCTVPCVLGLPKDQEELSRESLCHRKSSRSSITSSIVVFPTNLQPRCSPVPAWSSPLSFALRRKTVILQTNATQIHPSRVRPR